MIPTLSYATLATHTSRDDCWVAVRGRVFDVSQFLSRHPGGAGVLLGTAGQDGTDVFGQFHRDEEVLSILPLVGVITADAFTSSSSSSIALASAATTAADTTTTTAAAATAIAAAPIAMPLPPPLAPCCFFLARGSCKSEPCRYSHPAVDDGVSPCSFGATCRLGHKTRVLPASASVLSQQAFWHAYWADGGRLGSAPADRDARLLRSQLEPWPTNVLRQRLADHFPHAADGAPVHTMSRAHVMNALLAAYAQAGPRRVQCYEGIPVRADLCDALLAALRNWERQHPHNNRPALNAQSYMILRSPAEFGSKDSKNALAAAAKIEEWTELWCLATAALTEADPLFAASFTALAVTCNIVGSPHIDKQNTGPFYGLALGDFAAGTGALCVEADWQTVAHVNTRCRLGKVDGRFPHWVDGPYEGTRYSLIYYQTEGQHTPPTQVVFATAVD
jgi:predicted heme/steroid binding protein